MPTRKPKTPASTPASTVPTGAAHVIAQYEAERARVSDDDLPGALRAVAGNRTVCGSVDAAIASAGLDMLSAAAQRLEGQAQRDTFGHLNRARIEIIAAARRLRGDAPEPDTDPLRSRVAFQVCVQRPTEVQVPTPRAIMCVVIPHAAADYRTGRAVVYQLASKVEALALRPTWAATVDVKLADGATAATGVRGWVTLVIDGDDANANQARRHLHTAATAVLPEIQVVV